MVVGNSLGGCVALRLAERRGPELAGVLAVAPAGLEMSRVLYFVERDLLLRSLLALPTPVPSTVLRGAVARLYRQLALASPGTIDRAVISAFTGAQRVIEAVPGARLELLQGVGHCPQIEAPDRFAELLLEFGDQAEAAVA